MDTIYENESTPKKDGYRMPGEFEPQECIWMLWPHRPDNWRDGAKPAQKAYADVARGIARFEPVIVGVNPEDYAAAHYVLAGEENILVVEMTSDDSWIRDCGPTFVAVSYTHLCAAEHEGSFLAGSFDCAPVALRSG